MSQEDELAKAVMEQTKDSFNTHECTPEVHYNHYGSRGVVDLVEEVQIAEGESPEIVIFEFKSESAVRNATGANEIIRQFNRHKRSFFKGSRFNKVKYVDVSFELAFYATDFNLQHIQSNADLYRSVEDKADFGQETAFVSVRHPNVEGNGHPLKDVEVHGQERWLHEWRFSEVLLDARDTQTA